MALALVPTFAAPAAARHGSTSYNAKAIHQAYLDVAPNYFSNVVDQRCWSAFMATLDYAYQTYGYNYYLTIRAPFYAAEPDRVEVRCHGKGTDENGNPHWGLFCPWTAGCPEGGGKYISINHNRIYSAHGGAAMDQARYFYVMSHEMAHAVGEYYDNSSWPDECWADAVAVSWGASGAHGYTPCH